MTETETFLQASKRHARIPQPTAQELYFAAGAMHLKATVPAEKGVGHVLFRIYAFGRYCYQPRSQQD